MMILELTQVQKIYPKFRLDCSLKLEEGRVTGLIGRNGAGKTTVFKAILDLIRLDGGEIRIFGTDHRKLTPEQKEEIGVVFADAGFSSQLTIRRLLPVLEKFYRRFDRREFLDQCDRFGLPADRKLKEFSTGMNARLKVLAAMSHGARLLILDEPTAGLDVVARQELLDLLREYMEREDCSVLISSHIAGDLEHFCDDVYLIGQGEMLLHEDTDVILDSYGILKVREDEYGRLDKTYLLRVKRESFGYSCLTAEKRFYLENYPQITVERGGIDGILTMMTGGEEP